MMRGQSKNPERRLIPTIASLAIGILLFLYHYNSLAQPAGQSSSGLFESEDVLYIKLSGDIRDLLRDRSDDAEYHSVTLLHQKENGDTLIIPIKVKTRGHFRRIESNCRYPPLLLNFSKESTPENSIFKGQDKLKLVTPCTDEMYVVHEYLVYKIFNLITEKSFRARLIKVSFDNNGKETDRLYGILLEDEDQMAERNNAVIVKDKLVRPEETERNDFLKMSVFQYMIGNTDWSVQYYQNIKLIASDSTIIPSTVPYDFDHAGIVDASYAKPAEELLLSSTRQRRYRGYCFDDMSVFDETFSLFNKKKEEIYDVYKNSTLLKPRYLKSTIKFLDEFYKTINNTKTVAREFGYPCNKDGTGNVVIMGLKKK
jgi:hypothetical protein